MPAQVLAGVTILFSALIPLGQAPRTHSLGQLAEQYGAKCVAQEDPSVTHVVAQSNGSAKAPWAAAYGKHLVSRHWQASSPLSVCMPAPSVVCRDTPSKQASCTLRPSQWHVNGLAELATGGTR